MTMKAIIFHSKVLNILKNFLIKNFNIIESEHFQTFHQYIYKRQDGRHTSVTMQFYRSYVGDRDLPSSEKKDQLYLVLEGLDTVDFGTKVMLECLEGIQVKSLRFSFLTLKIIIKAGTKAPSDGDNNEDFTPCAAWDKDLGW